MDFEKLGKTGVEKEFSEEEILNSNNVGLIAEYAKEHRSGEAIARVRELLESARKTGEEVVQNFLNSFKECEREKKDYLDFENTASGRLALNLLETIPEPFRTQAIKKLEDYKKELEYNTALFRENKNNPEKIWKKVFGFDYYNIPDFKERFKTFLFKDVGAIFAKYYKDSSLEARQDPFAISFFVEDQKNFARVYNENSKHTPLGFSERRKKTNVNVINTNKLKTPDDINDTAIHESEHAVDEKVNPLKAANMSSPDLSMDTFDDNKIVANKEMRAFFLDSLKRAKDEIFAYQKEGTAKESLQSRLLYKIKEPLFREREEGILDEIRERNHGYDYNEELREANYKWIELSRTLTEIEKAKLKDALDFLQAEYDRVLKNTIDVIYEKTQSVEFFRNVPINELWKYSNGKYNRTDFIIREFKF